MMCNVQWLKLTLLDVAMKVEASTEGTSAIGGVMREIRSEDGVDGFVVLYCDVIKRREREKGRCERGRRK
jgi:hypothetical protein